MSERERGNGRRKLTGGADFQRLLICRQLKGARQGAGKSLVEAASATGIAHSTIAMIEGGHRDPSLGTVLMLLDYYGLVINLEAAERIEEPDDQG